MAASATFDSFLAELSRLVAKFEKEHKAVTDPGYSDLDPELAGVLASAYASTLARAPLAGSEDHAA